MMGAEESGESGATRRLRPSFASFLGLGALALVVWVAMQAFGAWSNARMGAQVAADARPGDIHMLSSETCVYCDQARAWFTAHRVSFQECTIERDAACAAGYSALMAPGTPVLIVKGRRLIGFDRHAVADALRAGQGRSS